MGGALLLVAADLLRHLLVPGLGGGDQGGEGPGEPLGEAALAALCSSQEEDEAGGWGRVYVRGFRPGGACGEDPPRKPQGPVEGP